MKKRINTGSTFEQEIAYSRAIVDGRWIFISGTTGFDYNTMTISEDIVEQTKQCFENIKGVLTDANAQMKDIVRVTYILPEAKDFEKCWPTIRHYLEDVRPAATMFSAGLADERMKIEIQVTARTNKET